MRVHYTALAKIRKPKGKKKSNFLSDTRHPPILFLIPPGSWRFARSPPDRLVVIAAPSADPEAQKAQEESVEDHLYPEHQCHHRKNNALGDLPGL